MGESKSPKAKNLMYTQQLRYLPQGVKTAEDLAKLIETKLDPVRYAVIIHDQETDDQPYFITGSSRDIFQGYAGEHTLILDELRPKVITYADLLRITDPFAIENRAMAPARYNDKALVCDLIIITTPFTPSDFYYQQFNANSLKEVHDDCPDGLDQLLRRITVTLEMTGKTIEVSQYSIRGHMFVPVPGTARPNPYSRLARPAPKNKMIDFYNSMFD